MSRKHELSYHFRTAEISEDLVGMMKVRNT